VEHQSAKIAGAKIANGRRLAAGQRLDSR
jgi:hypothetical protein